jgi:SulP family sulfate permease
MGFAIVAGISPLYGLYAAFIAPIIGSIFSNSTVMTIAPTNALAIVVGSTLLGFNAEHRVEYLFMLTLLVGI